MKNEILTKMMQVNKYVDRRIPGQTKEVKDYKELKKKYSKLMPEAASLIANTKNLATTNVNH